MFFEVEQELVNNFMMFMTILAVTYGYFWYRMWSQKFSRVTAERRLNQYSMLLQENENLVRDMGSRFMSFVEKMESDYFITNIVDYVSNAIKELCYYFNNKKLYTEALQQNTLKNNLNHTKTAPTCSFCPFRNMQNNNAVPLMTTTCPLRNMQNNAVPLTTTTCPFRNMQNNNAVPLMNKNCTNPNCKCNPCQCNPCNCGQTRKYYFGNVQQQCKCNPCQYNPCRCGINTPNSQVFDQKITSEVIANFIKQHTGSSTVTQNNSENSTESNNQNDSEYSNADSIENENENENDNESDYNDENQTEQQIPNVTVDPPVMFKMFNGSQNNDDLSNMFKMFVNPQNENIISSILKMASEKLNNESKPMENKQETKPMENKQEQKPYVDGVSPENEGIRVYANKPSNTVNNKNDDVVIV